MRLKPSGFAIAAGAAILLSVGVAVLSGWTADSQKTAGNNKLTQPAGKTPANTAAAAAPFYPYSARGKADPFKPFMETDLAVINKKAAALKLKRTKEINNVISPLQREEIDKFTLVGIIGDQNKRKAIVEDKKEKRHYPLFIGTYIGKNGGRVAEILADRVIVEEIVDGYQKKTKKRQVNRIEMFLRKEQ